MRSLFLLLLMLSAISLYGQPAELTPVEKNFQEAMNAVILQGQSTRDGKPGFSEDKYVIDKIAKQSGDTWTFHVRIPMKGQTMTVPFPIQVKWAGDTPVIMLTDQALPGLGTYSARVLIYKGEYAGTWGGKSGGGKVFGKVVKQ